MSDVNAELQNVIIQCDKFLISMNPQVSEIEKMRTEIDKACEFNLSGSIVPSSLAQDLLAVEKAYRCVSDIIASVDEGKVIRKKLADTVRNAAIRASGQSSADKRLADAEFITGKFGMEAARFEAFFKYCEKKLEGVHMRYYTVRAALTSIEQDLRIGSTPGMGSRQLVDSAPMPLPSSLDDGSRMGGNTSWGNI